MTSTKEQIAVMQAYVDGKVIESRQLRLNPGGWHTDNHPLWNWVAMEYRIKPVCPKTVRVPFENASEFIEAFDKHGHYLYACGQRFVPILIDDQCVVTGSVSGNIARTYAELLEYYNFADKSEVGKEVVLDYESNTVYCEPSQTQLAYDLGLPVERGVSGSCERPFIYLAPTPGAIAWNNSACLFRPTQKQMLEWLEEKGFRYLPTNLNGIITPRLAHKTLDCPSVIEGTFRSYAEAVSAAISTALACLKKQKETCENNEVQ